MFSYPDVVVICGEVEYHDAHKDVVLNPNVIIEVLSESTEAFDRGEKFTRYQSCNATLTDYVLVSQDKPQIEHFYRKTDGTWLYHLYAGLEANVGIPSIDCTLKLVDVYDRVVFSEE
jgi:Uma2 family endonuclease